MICPNCGKSTAIISTSGDDFCKALHKQQGKGGSGAATVWQDLVDGAFEEWALVDGVVVETPAAQASGLWNDNVKEILDKKPTPMTKKQREHLARLDRYINGEGAA